MEKPDVAVVEIVSAEITMIQCASPARRKCYQDWVSMVKTAAWRMMIVI